MAVHTLDRGPSPHLSWAELACRDAARTPYPRVWEMRAVVLAWEFEAIRSACGDRPIRVGSAYRTPAHNRAVGGARHSQHVEGRALDLYPPRGISLDRFYEIIRAYAGRHESVIFGLGRYPTFVHLDTRPRPTHGRLIVWQGRRAWAEVKA